MMKPVWSRNSLVKNPLNRRRISLRAGAALVMTGFLTAGCGLLSLPGTGPAPDLYDLSPKSTFDAGLPTASYQLVVEEPVASRALDSDRIAIRTSPLELKYYKGARWSDRAPSLVQTLLVESFENSGHIVAVGRQAIGLRGDYDLKLELREFHAELFDGRTQPTVRTRLNVKIIKQPSAIIIASETFERTAEADSESVPNVVNAFDEALGSTMKRVVGWTLKSIEAYQQRKKAEQDARRTTPLTDLVDEDGEPTQEKIGL